MWNNFSLFLCTSDVAHLGVCDRVNEFSLKEGGTWHIMVYNRIVLKLFNLSRSSKEL